MLQQFKGFSGPYFSVMDLKDVGRKTEAKDLVLGGLGPGTLSFRVLGF